MWGDETKFIDDAADQSIKIKGFDLDFDTLTWELTGLYAWGNGVDSKVTEQYGVLIEETRLKMLPYK